MSKRTKHQDEKLRESLSILGSSNRLLIKGSAGVGKTFMVNDLVKELGRTLRGPFKVLCSAPTHKALSVLKSKVKALDTEFKTVHSALHYQAVTDYKTGEKIFKPKEDPNKVPLKGYCYWVIDEASMIPKDMLEYIEKYSTIRGIKVIFVGDDKQLNPVDEEDSPVFLAGYPEVELTEIIRQGEGNPIIEISRNLSLINGDERKLLEDGKGFLYTYNESKIIEELSKVNGTDDFKYLAWSNKEIDRMNELVRKRIYGDYPAKIEVGETIVFDAPFGKEYHTNEELLVEDVRIVAYSFQVILEENSQMEKSITKAFRLKVYVINPSEDEKSDDILVIHEDSEKEYKKIIAMMNSNCKRGLLKYETRNNFLDRFAQFKYNHALTVHKSQGSTYKTAVLNVKNININRNQKEKQRLLYTGITRASDLLILYNV